MYQVLLGLSFLEHVDDFAHVLCPILRTDQRRIVRVDDYHILDAKGRNETFLPVYNRVFGFNIYHVPANSISALILLHEITERYQAADIAPLEVDRYDRDLVRFLHNAVVY